MQKILRSLAIVAVVGSFASFAVAGSNPHCPKCKMELSSKKDKMHSMAVKIKNKTYYCCAACGAHKAAPAKKH